MQQRAHMEWPLLPEVTEPAPPKRRRAWGKVTHEERYRRQRRDLLRAAARIAGRNGYQGTRVADIVTEAGLSKSTFYEHFGSKEDCFLELYQRTNASMLREGIEAAEANIARQPYEAVLAVVRALVGYVERDPRLAEVIRAELGPAQPVIRKQREETIDKLVALFVTLGIRLGASLDPNDLEVSGQVIVQGVTVILPDLEQDPSGLDERLQAIARLCCRALGLPASADA